MAVITISSQMGAGGYEIGKRVAQALGYEFADKNIIEGIFRQYGMTKFEDLYTSSPSFLDLFNHNNLLTIAMLNEIIEGLAQRGNMVILGRGGFSVLSAYANVLDVRLQAPLAQRCERVQAREGLATPADAEAKVNEGDEIRRKFVQMFYNRRWDDPQNFDLVLDTGKFSLETVTQQIISAVQSLAAGPQKPTDAPEVDPVLADAISKVLAYSVPA